jgi:hypothetical protein
MSDKLDKWIVIAGSAVLAVALSLTLLATAAAQSDGWSRLDQYPTTERLTLWLGHNRD